jgi:hypothetical protein
MKFFKNLSIRTKLFLISIIPSLGLIFLLHDSISESLDKKNTALLVYEECEDVERLSSLIHSFQRERGYYLGYLESQREQDKDKINQQEILTDQAIALLRERYRIRKRDSSILPHLDSLTFFRTEPASYPEKLNHLKSLLLNEIYSITRVSLSKENEIRTWLLTGNSKVNDHMRGDKDAKLKGCRRLLRQGNFLHLILNFWNS